MTVIQQCRSISTQRYSLEALSNLEFLPDRVSKAIQVFLHERLLSKFYGLPTFLFYSSHRMLFYSGLLGFVPRQILDAI